MRYIPCDCVRNRQSRRIRLISNTPESGRADIEGRSDYRQFFFFFGQRRGLGIFINVEEKGRGATQMRVRVPETLGVVIVLICGGGDVG